VNFHATLEIFSGVTFPVQRFANVGLQNPSTLQCIATRCGPGCPALQCVASVKVREDGDRRQVDWGHEIDHGHFLGR